MRRVYSKIVIALCLSTTACGINNERDRQAAKCAVEAQRLYPQDLDKANELSVAGGGYTYHVACMRAAGYVVDQHMVGLAQFWTGAAYERD